MKTNELLEIERDGALDAAAAPDSPARRRFMVQAAAGGGMLLGVAFPDTSRRAMAQNIAGTAVHAYIRIASDNTVTVLVGATDMGQGVLSGFAQIVCEELRGDWSLMRAEHAPNLPGFGNPAFGGAFRFTGGSTSTRGYFNALRQAGATAREMLIAAAAATAKVDPALCTAAGGYVTVNGTTRYSYGQLASLAATMTPNPGAPVGTGTTKLIGQPVTRLDLAKKVNGSAIYGIDVRLPGMLYAVIKHCPTIGGKVGATPSAPAGTLAVIPLDNAVAVVATSTWAAMKGARNLSVNWVLPSNTASMDSASIAATATSLMASGTPLTAPNLLTSGAADTATPTDTSAALPGRPGAREFTYSVPYLAHACMEVLNCTVEVTPTACNIWAPTQGQTSVVSTALKFSGITDPSKISITTTLLGGGLGRKIEQDYIAQAIRVAVAMKKPVKLMWPREEDFSRDFYRPMTLARIRAAIDSAGNITAWDNRIVSPSIRAQRTAPAQLPLTKADSSAVEGANDQAYSVGAQRIEWVEHPSPIPVGYWRSVGHSINAFTMECAIDELAASIGMDPLALRQKLLQNSRDPNAARMLGVLNAAAALAGWNTPAPVGRARGLALHASFGSIVAEVAEVSQPVLGAVKVHRVSVAIDCGIAVNVDSIKAQMEGCVVHGLASALWGKVEFTAGRSNVRNFNRYRMLRMREMPRVDVQVIQSGAPIGGVGEPGVPPVAPAVANALARLTGQRIRTLPMFPAAATMGE